MIQKRTAFMIQKRTTFMFRATSQLRDSYVYVNVDVSGLLRASPGFSGLPEIDFTKKMVFYRKHPEIQKS